jgi:hypothetical protein
MQMSRETHDARDLVELVLCAQTVYISVIAQTHHAPFEAHHTVRGAPPCGHRRDEQERDAAMQHRQSMSRTRDSIGQSCAPAGRAEMTPRRMGRAIFIMGPADTVEGEPRRRLRGAF